jgi:hypothetical protein
MDTSKPPSLEELNKERKKCFSLYDAQNSELKSATQSLLARLDDLLLKKTQTEKQ